MEKVREILLIESSNFIPALMGDKLWIDNNFIESSDMINKKSYQISNFGTHIPLNDGHSTLIDASIPYLQVRSLSEEKLIKFYSIVSKEFPEILVESINYNLVYHFQSDGIFKKVNDIVLKTKSMELKEIKFTKNEYQIELYECKENRLHINLANSIRFDESTKISSANFDTQEFISKNKFFLKEFLTKELNLDAKSIY